jgi:hypothetical protein
MFYFKTSTFSFIYKWLTQIINKTSAPIIFADDTILFAHSNLIDFYKNIYIVFTT